MGTDGEGEPDDQEPADRPLAAAGRFARLYDDNERAVIAFFYRRTGCAQTAADLAAETFAAAFASRERFRDRGAPARAWLFTIAHRQLAHYVRREQVSDRARHRLGAERVLLDDASLERVEQLVDLAPVRDALTAAVAELPARVRRALDLRITDGLPYVAIATELGCTEGAARVRVTRGLSRLADQLEEYR